MRAHILKYLKNTVPLVSSLKRAPHLSGSPRSAPVTATLSYSWQVFSPYNHTVLAQAKNVFPAWKCCVHLFTGKFGLGSPLSLSLSLILHSKTFMKPPPPNPCVGRPSVLYMKKERGWTVRFLKKIFFDFCSRGVSSTLFYIQIALEEEPASTVQNYLNWPILF